MNTIVVCLGYISISVGIRRAARAIRFERCFEYGYCRIQIAACQSYFRILTAPFLNHFCKIETNEDKVSVRPN